MTTERDSTMTLDSLCATLEARDMHAEAKFIKAHLSRKVSVSDDAVEIAEQTRCLVLQEGMPSNAYQCTKRLKAMRAALESLASRKVAVPDAKAKPTIHYKGDLIHEVGYVSGWNACRQSMLNAATSDRDGES